MFCDTKTQPWNVSYNIPELKFDKNEPESLLQKLDTKEKQDFTFLMQKDIKKAECHSGKFFSNDKKILKQAYKIALLSCLLG